MVIIKPVPLPGRGAPRQGRVQGAHVRPRSGQREATPCSQAAAINGWLDHDAVMMESLLASNALKADGADPLRYGGRLLQNK
jgi:hypothetical protein